MSPGDLPESGGLGGLWLALLTRAFHGDQAIDHMQESVGTLGRYEIGTALPVDDR